MNGTELQVTFSDNQVALPGCRFTATGAELEVRDADTFKTAFRFLHATTGANAWWWGDVIGAYAEWEKKQSGKDVSWKHLAAKWEEITGLSAGTIEGYCAVARAFKGAKRRGGLSWAHHNEVYQAGIEGAAAQQWFGFAIENQWTKTQLRAELRAAARRNEASEAEAEPAGVSRVEILAARRWATTQISRVEQMDLEEAQSMLDSLQPVLRLANALAGRVVSAANTVTPVGDKESL